MKVFINGKEEALGQSTSVLDLLALKDIHKESVAIELNEQILRRADYDSVLLQDGDKLEIVSYMGGG